MIEDDGETSSSQEEPFWKQETTDHETRDMKPPTGLKKRVSLVHGIGLVSGVIIGSGIFFTPNEILQSTGSVGLSLTVWIMAGLIAVGGALCYCELGSSIPQAGGEYVYLYRAYGPLPAFLFIWLTSFVGYPASQAVSALAFSRYLVQPFFSGGCEPSPTLLKLVGLAGILMLGIVNATSVKAAIRMQSVLLLIKVLSLVAVVVMGVYWAMHEELGSLATGFQRSNWSPSDIGLAFYNALWAYEGWNSLNYAAEEVKDPHKNILRAVVIGLILVIVCYITVNLAYFAVLDKSEFTKAFANLVGKKVIGTAGVVLMPLFVAISCFGSANGSLFTSSRILFAAARQRQLPSAFALVHKDFNTPFPAVILQVTLSILLISIGTLESLLEAFSFIAWIVYGFSFLSIYILRYKDPDLARPFKVWFWLPGLMILVAVFLVVVPLLKQPLYFLIVLMFVPGIALFYLVIRKQGKYTRLKLWNDLLQEVFIHLCNVKEVQSTGDYS